MSTLAADRAELLAALTAASTTAPALERRLPLLEAAVYALLLREQAMRLAIADTLAAHGWNVPAAVRHLQWAPVARARLEAALVGVPDALLDGRPLAGEWSPRQQLAHVELTDERYGIASLYAATRADNDPLLPPPDAYPERRGEPTGISGEPLAVLLARMRRVREVAIAPLLTLDADTLLRPTEWHNAENTLGFRLHRFAQHDLELTTDLQRTLAALGFVPDRPLRLAAALLASQGELAACLLGVPAALFDPTGL